MKQLKKISLMAAGFLLALMSVITRPVPVQADGINIPVRQTLTVQNAGTQSYSTTFSYKLTAGNTGNPMPEGSVNGTYSFNLTGNNASLTVSIPTTGLTVGQTFSYQLKEAPATPQAGYTYDSKIYAVEVSVVTNATTHQQEVVTNVRLNGTKVSEALFANTYDGSLVPTPTPSPTPTATPTATPTPSPTPVIVDPPVRKVIVGTPSQNAVFHFTMTGQPGAPMPAGANGNVKTASVTGAGEVEFGQFEIDEAGTYVYTLAEVDDGQSGYAYDGTVYTLTFVIEEDDDGDLYVAQRTVVDQTGNSMNTAVFSNVYQASSTPAPGTVNNEPNKNVPNTGDSGENTFSRLGAGLLGLAMIGVLLFPRKTCRSE